MKGFPWQAKDLGLYSVVAGSSSFIEQKCSECYQVLGQQLSLKMQG